MGRGRSTDRKTEADAAEDVGVQLLLSLSLLECAAPVGGGELQDAGTRPAREQAEEVAQVAEGLEAVEPAARDERDEGGVRLGPVLAADEEPVSAPEDNPQVILTISRFARACCTRGIRRTGVRSTFSTRRHVEVNASTYACCPTTRESSFPSGCAIQRHAPG